MSAILLCLLINNMVYYSATNAAFHFVHTKSVNKAKSAYWTGGRESWCVRGTVSHSMKDLGLLPSVCLFDKWRNSLDSDVCRHCTGSEKSRFNFRWLCLPFLLQEIIGSGSPLASHVKVTGRPWSVFIVWGELEPLMVGGTAIGNETHINGWMEQPRPVRWCMIWVPVLILEGTAKMRASATYAACRWYHASPWSSRNRSRGAQNCSREVNRQQHFRCQNQRVYQVWRRSSLYKNVTQPNELPWH